MNVSIDKDPANSDVRLQTKVPTLASLPSHQNLLSSSLPLKVKQPHEQKHISVGEVLKSIVYGGLDGVINVLVIILSSVASNTDARTILAFCIGIVVGDGISMGLGDYLSARAQIQYIKSQQQRQLFEVQNALGDELKEIVQIYVDKGFSIEDSARIAELYSTNKQAFVNIMMLEELGLVVVDDVIAMKCGIATFISFLVFGMVPVIPYIISSGIMDRPNQNVVACIVIGVVELFGLGFGKAKLIGINPWISGFQALVLGCVATGVAYGIGVALHE